jgi:hypothetical protein
VLYGYYKYYYIPNYAIELPNILLMLGLWVLAAYLRYTQRCIDAYAVNAHDSMICGRLVISIA